MRNSSSRPRSCFRFSVIARLLAFSIAIGKVVLLPGGARRRSGSPLRRLDLDHVGAGLRHQHRRVGALIDLPEIEHDDAGQRQVGACVMSFRSPCSRPCASESERSGSVPCPGCAALRPECGKRRHPTALERRGGRFSVKARAASWKSSVR